MSPSNWIRNWTEIIYRTRDSAARQTSLHCQRTWHWINTKNYIGQIVQILESRTDYSATDKGTLYIPITDQLRRRSTRRTIKNRLRQPTVNRRPIYRQSCELTCVASKLSYNQTSQQTDTGNPTETALDEKLIGTTRASSWKASKKAPLQKRKNCREYPAAAIDLPLDDRSSLPMGSSHSTPRLSSPHYYNIVPSLAPILNYHQKVNGCYCWP